MLDIVVRNKDNLDLEELNNFVLLLYHDIPIKPTIKFNKHFKNAYLVYDQKKLVAFTFAYINSCYPDFYFLGSFESVNNQNVASTLFDFIINNSLEKNYKTVIGPMDGATWFSYRFNLDATKQFFLQKTHLPYYISLWENYGFTICDNYQSDIIKIKEYVNPKLIEEYLKNKNLNVKTFNSKNWQEDLSKIHQFSVKTFSDNNWYSPISLADFIDLYQPLLPFLDNELILLCFEEEQLVAFVFGVKNLYTHDSVIAKTVARNPSEKYKGLGSILSGKFYNLMKDKGYTEIIAAYKHIENNSIALSDSFGSEQQLYHVLYKLDL